MTLDKTKRGKKNPYFSHLLPLYMMKRHLGEEYKHRAGREAMCPSPGLLL